MAAEPDTSIEEIREMVSRMRELLREDGEPGEGLRERKKRETRQEISDVATVMFCVRGFDHVRVSEIAAEAGVSEKTVFNYFPSKESLVFDEADALEEALAKAVRTRAPEVSPTEALITMIDGWGRQLVDVPDDIRPFQLRFREMIAETPELRVFQHELTDRFVDVIAGALAEAAEIDPRAPEPRAAAFALAALFQVWREAYDRHLADGLWGEELHAAAMDELRRAARLLDTGLWSFNVVVQGVKSKTELVAAAKAAKDAHKQVGDALKRARDDWRDALKQEIKARKEAEFDAQYDRFKDRKSRGRRGR
ncbi:MAG: TetR family transcriptional regulator [Solirubrobacteraceae bacterium]|nr:TetR family transcriptional regulator [Solirubrobacteraceae bacterium]